ncbi:MAG: OmpA family protein [Gelidibacter sp.]
MKNSILCKKLLGTALLLLFMIPSANAQILKRLQKSAERTVERKLERKTEKETGKMMDSILDPSQKSSTKKTPTKNSENSDEKPTSKEDIGANTAKESSVKKNVSEGLEVYSKFDFVPGDKILFYDDFSQDFVGDFPSKWNTNGSGEVVKINNVDGNQFVMKSGYKIFYIPDVKNLPEDYTIEFDLVAQGIDGKTSSNAVMGIILSDNNSFENGNKHFVETTLPFCQFYTIPIRTSNYFNGNYGAINSSIDADIRKEVLNRPHISIAVTKNRYRLWVNETKYIDIPRMIQELTVLKAIKFYTYGFEDTNENVLISNLKVAAGGEDLRRKLLSEGKISTNGILFDSGSAKIKPQSLGIVLQISQVLLQDENINLNIVGHTDAEGNSDTNLKLSKERAQAVKDALVNLYNIPANRLQTDGKGASVPVAENSTADGKAQNRRVEFIKI